MGVVVDGSGKRLSLGARTILGRSRACALRVSSGLASGEHACILWHRERWVVRDLASTNGTWVSGRRMQPGERRELERHAVVALGSAEGPSFTLEDDGPPVTRAVETRTGAEVSGSLDLIQLLGGDGAPTWTIYDDGARWICERDGEGREIVDQEILEDGERVWRIELPPRVARDVIDTTESDAHQARPLELFTVRFEVSSDEEHVSVALVRMVDDETSPETLSLTPRVFHYMLATLARRRLDDRRSGVPDAEAGWIYADDLARMLAVPKPKLNLDVCRARQQLAEEAKVVGAGRIIERRATSGQLRIGVGSIEVVERRADGRSRDR